MNEVIEWCITLAREAEEQYRLAQEAEWQTKRAEQYETARSFIEVNGLGDLLTALGAGEMDVSKRDYIATVPLEYVVKGWRYEGQLEIYYGSNTVTGRFSFGDSAFFCEIHLPKSLALIGKFLLTLEECAQRQYASQLNDAVNRMRYLDQPILDQHFSESLALFPQALELDVAYDEALERIEEEQRQNERCVAMAEAVEEERKREDEARSRMQREVFYPFVAYKVEYGVVVTFDDGDVMVESNTAYSLRSEPEEGWWTFVSSVSGKELRQMRLANLISVERLEITEPGGVLCTYVDGVWYPPVGAERLSVISVIKEQ